MNSTSFEFTILALLVLLFGVFAAAVNPRSTFAATLLLTADTFPSNERLNWARVGSTITVTVEDAAANTHSGALNTITVDIESDEIEDESFGFTLAETNVDTGIFQATFSLSAAVSSPTILQVDPIDDNVVVIYLAGLLAGDFDVENGEPDMVVITPDHEDKVDDKSVEFVVEVTDDKSGLTDPDDLVIVSVVFLVSNVQCGEQDGDIFGGDGLLEVLDGTHITMADLRTAIEGVNCDGVGGPDIFVVIPDPGFDFDVINNGQELNFDLFLASRQTTYVGVAAVDDAGIFSIFNVDPLDEDVVLLEVKVDENRPQIDVVRTGVKWDPIKDRYEGNQRNWLQVLFPI